MARTGERRGTSGRSIVYCVVPYELARPLHESLRRHFAGDPSIEVVVERRARDRRSPGDRRRVRGAAPDGVERRRIRARGGRRVAERRTAVVPAPTPELPRRARRYADRLLFVERLEPCGLHEEDADTARLVSRFQAGDRAIFDVLYARYFDRVYGYLMIALRDAYEAEDATQHVFMRALEALPSYELGPRPVRAWLFTIVRNHALDVHARRGRVDVVDQAEMERRLEASGDAAELPVGPLTWISDRELMLFVERLPAVQREVLVMRFMLGLRSTEIAETIGRTPADVRMLQSRALRFLRERLTSIGHGPRRPSQGARMRRSVRPAHVLRSRRFMLMR